MRKKMSKTPEQMADEYAEFGLQGVPDSIRKQQLMAKDRMAFLAGYKAAMNFPEKPDTCEHILDMEKMVDVNSSSGWISVKDRLPEDHNYYLVTSKKEASSTPHGWIAAGLFWDMEIAYFHQRNQTWMTGIVALNCKEEDKILFAVSYWMPLPKPPEE
jgi:hypothetical protein